MCVKSTEQRFAEIVAEVEMRVETRPEIVDWILPVNNEVLAVLRSMQSKLARLQEESTDKSRAIEYLQTNAKAWEEDKCCCRCVHRLELKASQLFAPYRYICKGLPLCVPTMEHGICDLWEHIPSSQDPVGKNERLYRAVQKAETGILNLKYALEEWNNEEGTKPLQDFLLKLSLATARCICALSDCTDESREFPYEKGIKD